MEDVKIKCQLYHEKIKHTDWSLKRRDMAKKQCPDSRSHVPQEVQKENHGYIRHIKSA